MHDATDVYCDGISPHLFWANKFGPRSGFGLFGMKAQRIKGLDLSEFEWEALTAACSLAFLHWEQTGPFTVKNNLRFLAAACDSNAKRAAKGREQKIRLHQLEALVACAEWFVLSLPRVIAHARRAGVEVSGHSEKRHEAVKALKALIPRLKHIVSEAR